jgi:hypothetical protein
VTDEVWLPLKQKKTKNLSFTGTYQDKWFGDVVISEKKGKLFLNLNVLLSLAERCFL